MDRKARRLQIEWFLRECRGGGLNVTPQRLAIYEALLGDGSHPSPDEVYRRIKRHHPTISLATVYKTLETFERHGIVSLLTPLHQTVRYDPLTMQHHHIVCVRCKKVMDLVDGDLDAIPVPRRVRRDNQLVSYSIHYNVVCSSCTKRG